MINWVYALQIVAIGFTLVFAILIALAAIMHLIKKISERRTGDIPTKLKEQPPSEKESDLTDEETAAIFGAIINYMEQSEGGIVFPSIPSTTYKWVDEGRRNLMKPLRREVPRWASPNVSRWKLAARKNLMTPKARPRTIAA